LSNFCCFDFFFKLEGNNANEGTVLETFAELNNAINGGVQREISAEVNVGASVEAGTALANDDIACHCDLATEEFNTESLTNAIATVIGTTYTFLMCHDFKDFARLINE
jgi:hypothetical protein